MKGDTVETIVLFNCILLSYPVLNKIPICIKYMLNFANNNILKNII